LQGKVLLEDHLVGIHKENLLLVPVVFCSHLQRFLGTAPKKVYRVCNLRLEARIYSKVVYIILFAPISTSIIHVSLADLLLRWLRRQKSTTGQ